MSTRRMTVAPVRAINPDNLKAILDFLVQMLPVILQLFIPKASAPPTASESSLRADFLAALEKDFAANPMTPEEFLQVSSALMAFLQMYRDYVNPPTPTV